MPKFSVHTRGNQSTAYARAYVTADTLAQVKEHLAAFARLTYAEPRTVDGEVEPGAWSDVYVYDERDSENETWGDYPLVRFETGPRGGIRRAVI